MPSAKTGGRVPNPTALTAAIGLVVLSILHFLPETTGAQVAQGPSYTEAQARSGEAAYQRYCATCHRVDLTGSAAGPALAGAGFMSGWGTRSVGELLQLTQATMPPEGAGILSAGGVANVIAYVLKANGVPAGVRPVRATDTSMIGAGKRLGMETVSESGGAPRSIGLRADRARRPDPDAPPSGQADRHSLTLALPTHPGGARVSSLPADRLGGTMVGEDARVAAGATPTDRPIKDAPWTPRTSRPPSCSNRLSFIRNMF